jgi:hypothetical protein
MRRRLLAVLVTAGLWLGLPEGALAHAGDGIDVGFAQVTAEQIGGTVTVMLDITQASDCTPFTADGLSAARGETVATGSLRPAGDCLFSGVITLPEPGRWTLTVGVRWEGRPTGIVLPVGVTAEPGTFERAEWLHVALPQERLFRSTRTAISAVIGLLLGGAWEVTRRRRTRRLSRAG